METIGRKALFEAYPSNDGKNVGDRILDDWAETLKSAIKGDTSARINLDIVDGSLKSLGETLNIAMDIMAEVDLLQNKAELFIRENPLAIAVLGPNKSCIDINREYERVWRGRYEELMRKKLYEFDIMVTGGDDMYASFETKRHAVSEMELKWPNGEKTYVTLSQVPVLDDNGDILVNYYIYQDRTKDLSVQNYLNNEVERLKVNLEMFARGDLKFNSVVDVGNDYTTAIRDKFTQINGSIDEVRDAVGAVVKDMGTLAVAGVEGKLDTRVDASKHQGDFRQIVEGVNDTLDAVVGPLNVAAEYVDRIGKGEIPEKITDVYAGDFNEIKNNLNLCIDGLGGLVEADLVLQKVAANDYTAKVEGNYVGLYADVASSLNEVIDRLLHIQNTVQNVAAGDLGDLSAYKAVGRRSENDKMIPSFVDMMEKLEAVVNDAEMLAEAGVKGQLDVRADATRHAGAYGEVIRGINNCLDAVVGPLNVTAEYVDRIGKGDIPEKITDVYAGDFNEIKNNLNLCIDGLGGLVEADLVLQKVAANDYTAKVEGNYVGLYADVASSLNEVIDRLLHIQNTVQNVAAGDLGDLSAYKAVGRRSENDKMIPSFVDMMENLEAVVNDAEMLAEAGVKGQLDVRADATHHAGAYGEVIRGINNCLDAVVGPLNVAAEYVDRIGKGDIPEKITDVYAGDFNEIKNNLNLCIDGLGGLVEADLVLQKVAANDYTAKVEGNYVGLYADVASSLNEVIDRLLHIQNTVQNVAAGDLGDLSAYKAVGRRSENDKMIPSFVDMMEKLEAVVNDAEMLAEAGVKGQLDVRADATRHAGAYGEVIRGINNCLDAVVGPLNVTAEYVDRISKGNIPAKIMDDYAGDFNEIKNNLNGCIDAVNLLVKDTNMLADAAAAGKLTTRADISQHSGDYAKIVGGLNQTLDIINEPFREMNAAIVQLDVTADETTRGADEIAKAAEQVAVTSQFCADLSNSLITQIEAVDRQVADLSASNEEIASTSQEVHEHAVQTAEIGEKAQELGAVANSKMNIVETIAKQSVDEIQNLNSRMQEIDNVVKQVNDIANQINLLALNAAIEAARAGEHGRGFAVVAGEVRNLAEEAKQATGRIDQVIAGVQAISAKTAEAIGSAHNEIGSGVASVNATIEALNEIVQGSRDVRINIDEIAKAIEEQANMANRIVEAMEESNRLTRENQRQVEELASLAEEASASTEEIGSSIYEVKNMAGGLKQTMDKFEV
ncbi:methyl-accepting chemotaxis protein [Methanogenium organophilum]|uniref:Methyl-accepting chemotaxis protein n=1 Tax=Methanogenium organophilum TaxID=2199 RepID=A0A9X9S591_METOG|nr:methyl-accepting chemotaxis protein [Methanogenium organophilum]WAI02324.1 methyl-accepting chemotaxis protein [Methanogenium organophilum]